MLANLLSAYYTYMCILYNDYCCCCKTQINRLRSYTGWRIWYSKSTNEDNNCIRYINYVDAVVHILMYCGIVIQIAQPYAKTSAVSAIHGVLVLSLWCKLIHYMRPYSGIGHTLSIIATVYADVKIILWLLCAAVLAFAHTMYAITKEATGANNDTDSSSTGTELHNAIAFDHPAVAIRSAVAYMFKGFDLQDLDDTSSSTGHVVLKSFIWIIFMVLVILLLLNVLLAAAVER
jgi:hypothetical protein